MPTLDLTQLLFPDNVVDLLGARLSVIDDRVSIVKREIRSSDLNMTIGVYAKEWNPTPNTYEFLGVDSIHASTLEQYGIGIMSVIKNTNEEQGLIAHSVLSETIRTILAGDAPLRAQLGGLTVTYSGVTKRLKRYWVTGSRYRSLRNNTNNWYLALNDIQIEVEKING